MTVKIGLIADIHACRAPLEEALNTFRSENVSLIICLGDIAGYGDELEESVELIKLSNCVTLMGNHESWYLDSMQENVENPFRGFFSALPKSWESSVEGVRIYAVHASPPDSFNRGIKLLDENGSVLPAMKRNWTAELEGYSFDVLIVGHTHQVFAEWLGNKLVINPGSTRFNHTCAILSLPDKEARIIPLSGKEPLKAWNWGMIYRS